MEVHEMRENMSSLHRDLYRSMLGVNEVPEAVLRRYFAIKKTLDRISGHLSPTDLLRIAMDVGFNPETREFETLTFSLTNDDANLLKTAGIVETGDPYYEPDVDPNAETTIEEQIEEIAEEIESNDGADPEVEEPEPEPEPEEEPEPTDIGESTSEDMLDPGTEVRIFHDNNIKNGVIKSGEVVDGVAIYQVDIDGTVLEFTEDDIDEQEE